MGIEPSLLLSGQASYTLDHQDIVTLIQLHRTVRSNACNLSISSIFYHYSTVQLCMSWVMLSDSITNRQEPIGTVTSLSIPKTSFLLRFLTFRSKSMSIFCIAQDLFNWASARNCYKNYSAKVTHCDALWCVQTSLLKTKKDFIISYLCNSWPL